MTRKDYVLIAAALRDTLLIDCPSKAYLAGARAAYISAVTRVADALERANPNFKRAVFLKACGQE